jgi:hypothetical protein
VGGRRAAVVEYQAMKNALAWTRAVDLYHATRANENENPTWCRHEHRAGL